MRALLLASTLLAAAVPAAILTTPEPVRAAKWDEAYFPNHQVINQDGKVLNFYDDLIDGKIVIVNFIYTHCPDMCGLSTARMSYVRDELGDRIGKDIFIVSVSLDPERDTPEALQTYSEAFGRQEGWDFITGDPEQIKEIRFKLGERARKPSEHRTDMTIGNDNTGRFRRISLMGNLQMLAETVRRLDPEFKPAAIDHRQSIVANVKSGDLSRPGESLFQKACTACHTIGHGDKIGPDLHGLNERRDREWLFNAIMMPDALRKLGDPQMVELDAQYPGVFMPDLDLSRDDTRDVLMYIAQRTVEVNLERHGEDYYERMMAMEGHEHGVRAGSGDQMSHGAQTHGSHTSHQQPAESADHKHQHKE